MLGRANNPQTVRVALKLIRFSHPGNCDNTPYLATLTAGWGDFVYRGTANVRGQKAKLDGRFKL